MIDTHAHIFDTKFDADRSQTIARAIESGVQRIILPAIDSQSHSALMNTLAQFPDTCYGAMGLHPTSVNDNPHWQGELKMVSDFFHSQAFDPKRFVAVGEVGLDLYWSKDFLTEQTQALEAQIELSIEFSLPLILHIRDAWQEVMPIMNRYKGQCRGVFHSFSGTLDTWHQIQELGLFAIGISGPVTYKKSPLSDILPHVPLTSILLETDSPYLSPTPHRGQRNESSYLPLIAQAIAQIKGVSPQEVQKVTQDNANSIFFI